jgi:hypothetical protein
VRYTHPTYLALLVTGMVACVSNRNDDGNDTAEIQAGSRTEQAKKPSPRGYSPVVTAQSRLNHRLRELLHIRWRKIFRKAGPDLFYLMQTLDLDNDDDEDVLITYSVNPRRTRETYDILETVIFRNTGEDFRMESTDFEVQLNDATVADFNADGLQDIFVADTGPDAEPFPGAQSRLLLQTHDGKLLDATSTNAPKLIAPTHAVCSGDYDSDGDADLFLAIGNKRQVLWENDGSGKFTDATSDIFPAELSDNGEEPEVSFRWCETADFNRDGRDDLVLGQQDIGRPEQLIRDDDLFVLLDSHVVLYGDPAGKLVTNYASGLLPVNWDGDGDIPRVTDMDAADFDQDGCVDLLVASTSSGLEKVSNFGIYSGDCSGAFSAPVDYSVRPSVQPANKIHVTDFNRDGFLDFVPYYLFDPNPDGGPEVPPVRFQDYESRAYIFTRSAPDPFAPRRLRLREVEQLPLKVFHGLYHSELPGYTGITR